ncbi:unnamed protein product [Acanthoscelides obtectus]|uniref:C2H2-type domain-containing protein n=1 Tax=Acanthoscelides obtectus TaxID=200917 RepID=A0A9P0LUX3_ACAOB|nr:unnamed protein product [Acanthoscelides obtectus]CAK1645141.1 Zinc finger protein 710 [Acanthoscelides obtectus]
MANTTAENEADSGSGIATTLAVPDNVNIKEEEDQNDEMVTGSTNYDSSDSTSLSKCLRCSFESPSRVALAAHVAQAHGEATPAVAAADVKTTPVVVVPAVVAQMAPAAAPAQAGNTAGDRQHRKMFECDVCNMKFSNGANMRRHKMRHTGVKPYECRVCQKRFFRKDHLAEHFTTHTKTLPHHCPICNRGFQRQIAMRAHFQNEHVGQHDLVKSCPLCNYRAGSMKSLRIHFFNRHGIDLDNPGPAGSQAALLQQAFQQQQAAVDGLTALSQLAAASQPSGGGGGSYSDSGESTGNRSTDNATPPMHFLTPQVEISMADGPAQNSVNSNFELDQKYNNNNNQPNSRVNGECPASPQSGDSNSNAPTSSLAQSGTLRIDQETSITPSISLIPIKQEPGEEYEAAKKNGPVNLSTSPSGSVQMQTATSSSLSNLIKVSPLKSLLRDDLKRKIVQRGGGTGNGGTRGGRGAASPTAAGADGSPPAADQGSGATNGAVCTSTGPEQPSESSLWRGMGKRALSGHLFDFSPSLQCVFCGIGFPDQTLYFLHKGCHSDANPWKCNICGEQCCNVYEFNSHLLSKSHQ